ncbi:MAG: thiamine-phosphate kinase [Gammaproteobacteria bacterium]|nr:thiamine-phosphate kinase [Gammaproteobacteria bacterium]
MAEFQIIKNYFDFEQKLSNSIVKSIGDDCAILDIPKNKQLVTSTDTLVAGVHFFDDVSSQDLAYKALAVNVSDLLAMGAKPLAFTLAITLPEINHDWLRTFSESLQQAANDFSINLVGGDTTQGPFSISITVMGLVKKGKAILRNGAKLGDDIWVTGSLGSARSALKLHGKSNLNYSEKVLWQALIKPEIPTKFSRKLAKFATSAIDISDGLLADLGHIMVQSQLGAQLIVEALPLQKSLIDTVGIESARQLALAGGDDYQLCFTANRKHRQRVLKHANKTSTQVTRIGKIIEHGYEILLEGETYPITENSWQHFKSES